METIVKKSTGGLFAAEHVLFWSHLSRLNSLLVICNISLFFLTGLVAQGYYYTCYSMAGLGLVGLGLLIPTGLIRDLRYYLLFVAVELAAVYFLVASIVYWVRHTAG